MRFSSISFLWEKDDIALLTLLLHLKCLDANGELERNFFSFSESKRKADKILSFAAEWMKLLEEGVIRRIHGFLLAETLVLVYPEEITQPLTELLFST